MDQNLGKESLERRDHHLELLCLGSVYPLRKKQLRGRALHLRHSETRNMGQEKSGTLKQEDKSWKNSHKKIKDLLVSVKKFYVYLESQKEEREGRAEVVFEGNF